MYYITNKQGHRMSLNKQKWIKDAKIKFLSLVNKGANKRTFAVKKSDDEKKLSFNIIKSEKKDWSVVKGVVYEPNVLDTHGHKMSAEEIQKMAHLALENGLSVDVEHNEKVTACPVVESYIVEKDEDLNGQIVKKGSWVAAVKVTDKEIKKAVDDGLINDFSMAGWAILEDIEKASLAEKFAGKEIRNLAWSYAEIVDQTFRENLETDELIGNLETNLSQLQEMMSKEIDKMKTGNIKKSNKGAEMPELTEEKISEMIAKGVVEGIAKNEKTKEENLAKSADAKEISELKKTVELLKDKILKSDAGKDGGEDLKKSDEESTDSWL